MPVFELDAGRPVRVEPLRPAASSFPGDTASVVANHLGSLLGEQLFPVSTRQQRGDGPHLLAVDAAGQPVVVEVESVLDADALVRALRFAGGAARLTSGDLARSYHGGPERFATELVAFRENVPVAAAHAAARHAGARLLIVCSEVAENAADAVEFLRQAGGQVKVLQVGVLQGADGRRYVDVSPHIPTQPARRGVEPSALEAVQHLPSPLRALQREARITGVPSALARSAGSLAPVGSFPSVLPVPVGPVAMATSPGVESAPAAALAPDVAARPPADVPAAEEPDPDPMLAALAAGLATPTSLVWDRRRRGQRLLATLRRDGRIQLADGAVYTDPDDAAAAAADSEYSTDGWRVWRLGADGPSLEDLRNS